MGYKRNSLMDICSFNFYEIFKKYKWLLLALFVLWTLGLVLGICLNGDDFNVFFLYEFKTDYYLIIFNSSESSLSIFLSRLANNFSLILVIGIFSIVIYTVPLNFLLLLYRGYIIGSVIAIIGSSCGISGIFIVAFLILPIQISVSLILISTTIFGVKNALNNKRCGLIVDIKNFILKLLLFFLITVFIALVEIIIIGLIIRPFNIII